MKILLLGSGAREHALARALALDPTTTDLVIAPGNPGTASIGTNMAIHADHPEVVVDLATQMGAELVVIGSEAPLVAGVADALRAEGIPVFGPGAGAARLEGSKAFAKEVMAAAGAPTAAAVVCATEAELAEALGRFGAPYVVKNEGLAAGKGVVVTSDRAQALTHGLACLAQEGGRVVVEEHLDGAEVSLFCLCDGATVVPLAPAQDYKRIGDGGTGPNTGGMGAYSPLPWAGADLGERVVREVAQPVCDEMARRGTPFTGLLCCGLSLTSRGLRVVGLNVCFGDPQTQVVLARLAAPLGQLLLAAATGGLAQAPAPTWSEHAAVNVVLAAPGYPGAVTTGGVLTGVEQAEAVPGVQVLHAGTGRDEAGRLVADGGRVLSVVGTGQDLAEARSHAYEAIAHIHLDGAQHRTDIAAAVGPGSKSP